uniref:Nuclear Testis protein N-terminal domain-containing protein n=1 Tax=Otolemur garnettii TaxID=30611 RepID=H0X6L4_OTOGA
SFVSTASSVLRPDMTLNPDASTPPFIALPFHPPGHGPAYRPPWGQQLPPLMTAVFPPRSPLVLSTLPKTPLVAGDSAHCHCPSGAEALSVILQVKSEGRSVQAVPTQTFVLPQAPLKWSASGALCRGAPNPVPLLLTAPPGVPVTGGAPTSIGGWITGLPHLVPPLAAHLTPNVSPVNTRPQPYRECRESSLPLSTRDDSCNAKSVYENYQWWQHFKSLAWRHFPQSPDTEAFSCFLIPVLRTLARLKPTMTLDEGLWRAVQEWQQKNDFDRMIFYEMAEKFMEFEAEEEMQLQQLKWMKGSNFLPPSAPCRPSPQDSTASEVVQQPGLHPLLSSVASWPTAAPAAPSSYLLTSVVLPRKVGNKPHIPPPTPDWQLPENKAPKEIPPEVMKEYLKIMDKVLGPPCGDSGELDTQLEEGKAEPPQYEAGTIPDPRFLCYIDKLCTQEDFITKVEAVIHPRFLEELLSAETNMDSLALTQELEKEEGLTLDQMVEKRLLALKEEQSMGAAQSYQALWVNSSASKSAAGHGTKNNSHRPKLEIVAETYPAQMVSHAPQGHGRVKDDLPRPKAPGLLSWHAESPRLRATQPTSPFQGLSLTTPGLGTRDASGLQGASPVRETFRQEDGSSEDEEELPSLAFLLASQHRLLPWGLSQNPVPGQPPSAQRRGFSPAAPPMAKSSKQVICGYRLPAERMAYPGSQLRVSGAKPLALRSGQFLKPQKRRSDPFFSGTEKKQCHTQ